jgi:hypothetical protein
MKATATKRQGLVVDGVIIQSGTEITFPLTLTLSPTGGEGTKMEFPLTLSLL